VSGGSYDYLYAKDFWLNVPGELQEMADRLTGLGFHDAAVETNQFRLELQAANARIEAHQKRLADVWKAVEWTDSSDWGPDSIDRAIAAYRGEKTPA
jgi:hypothetical protein